MTFLFSYNSKEYDQFYDMVVYSTFIALGFAWIENILYSYDGGLQVALLRGLLSVPAHVSVSVFMGYYLSLSKIAENNKQRNLKIKYILLSIFIPTFLHGIYDFLIYYNNYVCIYFYYLFVIILYRRAYLKVKVSSLM